MTFMYVLSDEDGELHLPKDNQRREIEVEPEEEQVVRQQTISDVNKMAQSGLKLAPRWWKFRNVIMNIKPSSSLSATAVPFAPRG